MPVEGMVDALREAHRVLVPGATLVDIRPDRRPPDPRRLMPSVRALRADVEARIGVLYEEDWYLDACAAADAGVALLCEEGRLARVGTGEFEFRYHFGSLADVDRYFPADYARVRLDAARSSSRAGRVVVVEPVVVRVLRRV